MSPSFRWLTALRIFAWRFRYAWRVFRRTRAPWWHPLDDLRHWRWCFTEASKVGWDAALDAARWEARAPVEYVLDEVDPVDEADEELSYWDDDEGEPR